MATMSEISFKKKKVKMISFLAEDNGKRSLHQLRILGKDLFTPSVRYHVYRIGNTI